MTAKNRIPSSGRAQIAGPVLFEFKSQHRNIPDEDLLADLRRVARLLGQKTLDKETYKSKSKYDHQTLCKRFGSWNTALQKAGLKPSRNFRDPTESVIADIRKVARKLKARRLCANQYTAAGKYSESMIYSRFGSWPNAAHAAGIAPVFYNKITLNDLFQNMEHVWLTLGRQPKGSDMFYPLSKFSQGPYMNRFGGFGNALRAFTKWKTKNPNYQSPAPPPPITKSLRIHKTNRTINWRLRYEILSRDKFKCRACGQSPATNPNVRLQVDHIKPWSTGGETVRENLQTLCDQCNIGKSNL